MALIKCPECGREKVSDTAKACPECGFNIAEYYSNAVKTIENDATHTENNSSDNVESDSALGCFILFLMLFLDVVLFIKFCKTISPIYLFLGIPVNLFGLLGFAKYDPKGFNDAAKYNEQKRQKRNYSPDCPVCHSHNTSKISMLSRGVSVELFGLASDSIGKQYICLDCRHKW